MLLKQVRKMGGCFYDIVVWGILVISTSLCVFPLLNVLSLSLSDKAAAAAGLVTFFPVNFSLVPYEYLIHDHRFFRAFFVSVQRVILGGSINFALTVTLAYPLSKNVKEFRQRNIFMWILIFAMIFNGGLIPWYLVVRATGITNTIWALVLPRAVPIFNVILLMNYFRGIPKEISEAATIDGIGPWKMLILIFLPLALPALATVTLFSLVGHWNEFFDGIILINSQDKIPLQTYIRQLVVRPADISRMDLKSEDIISKLSARTFNAAKIVATTIPILVVYPFMQKYFIKGITLGSVKG